MWCQWPWLPRSEAPPPNILLTGSDTQGLVHWCSAVWWWQAVESALLRRTGPLHFLLLSSLSLWNGISALPACSVAFAVCPLDFSNTSTEANPGKLHSRGGGGGALSDHLVAPCRNLNVTHEYCSPAGEMEIYFVLHVSGNGKSGPEHWFPAGPQWRVSGKLQGKRPPSISIQRCSQRYTWGWLKDGRAIHATNKQREDREFDRWTEVHRMRNCWPKQSQ